jgi:hypothetical protein
VPGAGQQQRGELTGRAAADDDNPETRDRLLNR